MPPQMLPFDCAQSKLGERVLEAEEFNHLLSMTTPTPQGPFAEELL